MRDASGRIVLGDFGTGRELDEPEDTRGGLAGTPLIWRPRSSRGSRRCHGATSTAWARCCFTWRRRRIRSAADIVGSTNSKTVQYAGGTATLAQHQGSPGGYVPLVYGIPLSFRITFDRVTVTQ
jgi:hypothetical protein